MTSLDDIRQTYGAQLSSYGIHARWIDDSLDQAIVEIILLQMAELPLTLPKGTLFALAVIDAQLRGLSVTLTGATDYTLLPESQLQAGLAVAAADTATWIVTAYPGYTDVQSVQTELEGLFRQYQPQLRAAATRR